jgi:hypothetical protein
MKKIICVSAVLLTLGIITGCATLFAPKTIPLSISSEPAEADVLVNGLKMGVTPMELSLKADKTYTIEFIKEGFQSITRVVNTKVGAGWVFLDILGGIIPVIIDASTGAWYQFDQFSVDAVLEKQNK